MKPGLRLVQRTAQKQKQKMTATLKYVALGATCIALVGGVTFTYLNLGQSGTARAGTEAIKDPVKLRYFEGEKQGPQVVLKWRTLIEVENDYFTIERSNDGGNTFEPIAVLQGAGFSETRKDYTYIDVDPMPGTNYYRLGKTNFDGETVYSEPINIASDKVGAQIKIVSGGQNPNSGFSEVVFDADTNADVTIKLTDITGKEVYSKMLKPITGRNTFTFEDKTRLSAGVYIVSIENSAVRSNAFKLVKTR
jgi:hypothetical protein